MFETYSGDFFVLSDPSQFSKIKTSFILDTTFCRPYRDNFSDFHNLQRVLKISDKYYLLGGCLDTFPGNLVGSGISLYKSDTLMNFIDGRKYKFDGNGYVKLGGKDLIETRSGKILIGGRMGNMVFPYYENDAYPLVFMTDTSLSVQFSQKLYGLKGCVDVVLEGDSGVFYAGLNLEVAGTCLMKFHESGQIDWIKSYIRPKSYLHDGRIGPDGNIYLLGFTDSVLTQPGSAPPTSFDPAVYLLKIDTGGIVQFCKTYDVASGPGVAINATNMEVTNDGNFVFTFQGTRSPGQDASIVVKSDWNGDTLWTRFIGKDNYWNWVPGIREFTNGDLLLGGVSVGSFPAGSQDAGFMYRMDSLGYMDCFMNTGALVIGSLPVTDSLINLTNSSIHSEKYSYYTLTSPSVSDWTRDACLFLSVEFPQEAKWMKEPPYPNPSKNKVRFNNASGERWNIEVFDWDGKKIMEVPAQQELEIVLDVSHLPSGMYAVRFSNKHDVITQKIMVQQ
ncbi:MAG: T9SS type A sorting domain-containing protein [Bacteroidetes bacterium]|nr:T9SS type A sorting domain-containing protein [Bacteroidota bacterium]